MIKHTRGPWRVGDAGATIFGPPNEAKTLTIIAAVSRAPLPSPAAIANSRLISAAPEMYDLLRACEIEVMPGKEREPADGELWRKIRAVLKKVHGEV